MNTFIGFIVGFSIFIFAFMYSLRNRRPKHKHQTPFDDKLIELGVKEKWEANIDRQWVVYDPMKTSAKTFEEFISYSLLWGDTAEGHAFWYEISKK